MLSVQAEHYQAAENLYPVGMFGASAAVVRLRDILY